MIGKVISGRYQIIQSLGGGGFGQTFLAEDLQLPDHHKCVVKRLQPTSNENFIWEIASRLFETEARVLHKLGSHDRIPRLLAHFAEAHEFYLVQELVEGYDLSNEITSIERSADGYPVGRMNEAQAIAFLIDVLEILTFVHQQGAIHRDIKPANLMRRRTDGRLVLIDFGAVKQVGTAIAASAVGSTVAIGTDGYMPNEQAIGKPRPCSDLYAVGAIAIQGLTGVAPNLLSENLETGELAWRHSPDHAALKYRAQVSDELARIIDKLVKYDFRDRYQSAEAVLIDVQKLKIPIAPTLLSTTVQTSFPELTSAFKPNDDAATKFSPIASPSDRLQFAYKNRLVVIVVGIVSAISVMGAVVFLRPSPSIKNDVKITATSPNPTPTYLFLSERAISDQDLVGKSVPEIDIMRNEVFARYGRRFQDPELQSYFSSQPWYKPLYAPDQFPEELLTPIEMQNVTYIREFQSRTNPQYSSSQNAVNNLQNPQCDYTRRLVSDPQPPINVRQGAGVDFAIVGKLDNGTQITVQSEKQGWFQISAPIAGWVAANRTKPICL
ncbi:YARHG domain-containing protein [Pseudanabaena galeata UHCC 0370]|uniref:non-specific serine/threonine protein kinase n=1 Tax=Pseudanabaena galeata UHCC 0370 TaxID=3110310 RepID=A0ABU5TKW9_9CYAN|nr:YARHG domain-containing protein [Pseudanabaena galeata]MEA5478860.1 YARHG domain-containing protein [Pseudanabaena galeata UHCC 0370]